MKVAAIKPEQSKAGCPRVGTPSDRALLELLVREVAALRAEVAELSRAPAEPGLVDALKWAFGSGSFTVSGIMYQANRDGDLFGALTDLGIDLNRGHGAAVRLGMLLRKLDALETVGEMRGVQIYRLR
jgi:hypothetical protein